MENNLTRKLQRVGRNGSLAAVIPSALCKAAKFREHQRVQFKKVPGGILIHDAKTKHRKK